SGRGRRRLCAATRRFLLYRLHVALALRGDLGERAKLGRHWPFIASVAILNYIVASENVPALVGNTLQDTGLSPLGFMILVT
ncbi:MAG: hypothetical protein M3453_09580, partial [Pseudomonadota bacterium]|nr:hypothetical protein [Pseudomonadota bacterium]